jgi:hypothetical protein
MNKKRIFIIIFVVGVVASICAGTYSWKVATMKSESPLATQEESPTPAAEILELWKDQAGFTFSYPKDLSYDIHEEDQQNYAHIEFTHAAHPGTVIVWAKDTTASDATAWIKTQKALSSGTQLDTTFADMDGKKVLVGTPTKQIITAVVFDQIVFYVEGNFEDSEYWTNTYNSIVSSFAFSPPEGSDQSAGEAAVSGQEEVAVDEEEVLE